MIPAQDPALASPQCPLLVRRNITLGPSDHQPMPGIPITLITPWLYRATFFHGAQSTVPSVISLAWGPGVWEGRVFLSPFYRSNLRPGERRASPSLRADPEKSLPVHSPNPLSDR